MTSCWEASRSKKNKGRIVSSSTRPGLGININRGGNQEAPVPQTAQPPAPPPPPPPPGCPPPPPPPAVSRCFNRRRIVGDCMVSVRCKAPSKRHRRAAGRHRPLRYHTRHWHLFIGCGRSDARPGQPAFTGPFWHAVWPGTRIGAVSRR